jgi:hypothetical protein
MIKGNPKNIALRKFLADKLGMVGITALAILLLNRLVVERPVKGWIAALGFLAFLVCLVSGVILLWKAEEKEDED